MDSLFPFFLRYDDRQIRAEDHAVFALGAAILMDNDRRSVTFLIQSPRRFKDLFPADIEADPAFIRSFTQFIIDP